MFRFLCLLCDIVGNITKFVFKDGITSTAPGIRTIYYGSCQILTDIYYIGKKEDMFDFGIQ